MRMVGEGTPVDEVTVGERSERVPRSETTGCPQPSQSERTARCPADSARYTSSGKPTFKQPALTTMSVEAGPT